MLFVPLDWLAPAESQAEKNHTGRWLCERLRLDYLHVHPGLIGSRYASKEYDEFRVRSDRMYGPQ